MTIEAFEQQKKEIQIEISEIIVMPMQPFASLQELDDSLRSYQQQITQQLKQLQPPRPTCSTCNYINLECDSNTYGGFLCKNLNALNADGKVASTSGGYNIRIKDIKNFGCNQHSDYGVK